MDLNPMAVVDALREKFSPQQPQQPIPAGSAVAYGMEGNANRQAYTQAAIAAAEQGQTVPPFEVWVQQMRGR